MTSEREEDALPGASSRAPFSEFCRVAFLDALGYPTSSEQEILPALDREKGKVIRALQGSQIPRECVYQGMAAGRGLREK